MNNLSDAITKPAFAARVTIYIGVVLGLLWIVNTTIAFNGRYKVHIKNFTQLPGSIRYSGNTNTILTQQNAYAPVKGRTSFSITYPRGFFTSQFILHYKSKVEEIVTLSANYAPGKEETAFSFRHPQAIPENFTVRQLEGGRMYARDARLLEIPLAESIRKGKRVVGLGESATQFLTIQTRPETKIHTIPLVFRGSNALSAYLPEGTQKISLVKQDLNYSSGEDSYVVNIRQGTKEIFRATLADDGVATGKRGQKQTFQFTFDVKKAGLYRLELHANNEDSTIAKVSLTGAEINVHSPLYLNTQGAVTLFSSCRVIEAEAVKQSGVQVVQYANRKYSLDIPKQQVTFEKNDARVALVKLQRGDVALQSNCDFQLDKDQPYRIQKSLLQDAIVLLNRVEPKAIAKADIILDTLAIPEEKDGIFIARANFSMENLAAKGHTFTYHVDVTGEQKVEDPSVVFTQGEIVAERPAFRFADIADFLHK